MTSTEFAYCSVTRFACMWHWPAVNIWIWDSCAFCRQFFLKPVVLIFAATPCWREPTRSKQPSTVAILGFQIRLYHDVVALSRLRSNQLCFTAILSQEQISPHTLYGMFLKFLQFNKHDMSHVGYTVCTLLIPPLWWPTFAIVKFRKN